MFTMDESQGSNGRDSHTVLFPRRLLTLTFSFVWLSVLSRVTLAFLMFSHGPVLSSHPTKRSWASVMRLSLGLCGLSFCPHAYWRYEKGVFEMLSLRQLKRGRVRRRKGIIFIGLDLCLALSLLRNLIRIFNICII